MSAAIEGLSKATEDLGSLVASLVDRIEIVCAPSVPTPDTAVKVERSYTAPLAIKVKLEAAKVADCVSRIQAVLSRLEL